MMLRKIEVSNEDYNRFKGDMLNHKVLRKISVPLADVRFTQLDAIVVKGVPFTLNKDAIKGLSRSIGMSNAFVKTISKVGDARLIKVLSDKLGDNTGKITLVYNANIDEVVSVYRLQEELMSTRQYFDALETVISKVKGAYLRNIIMTTTGEIHATIANPQLEFCYDNKADEYFISGFTLCLSPGEVSSQFFTERLVCTNGIQSKDKISSAVSTSIADLPEFLNLITSDQFAITGMMQFKKRIERLYKTQASLSEVKFVADEMESVLQDFYPILTKNMSVHRIVGAFGEDVLKKQKRDHKYLVTDITVWDLINEITAVSSKIEQYRMKVSGETNSALQVVGGMILFKDPALAPNDLVQKFKPIVSNGSN